MKLRSFALSFTIVLMVVTSAFAEPTVFPTGVTIHEEGVGPGYLLYGSPDGVIRLYDFAGTELHTWTLPCGFQGETRPLANGNILTKSCGIPHETTEGALVEIDWDENVVWQFVPPEGVTLHHDWDRLDNGNTMILADLRDVVAPEVSDQPVRDEILYEVDGDGNIVWEWHLLDHFDEVGLSQEQLDMIRERGGDWAHANTASIVPPNDIGDPAFTPGNIIMSFRHTNTVLVVDRSTGNIVWTMTGQTVGQHNPHIIPLGLPGAGNMLIYDNGYASDWAVRQNRSFSIVKEIDPISREILWSYDANDSGLQTYTFFSDRVSNAQRLADGNTFIIEGNTGRLFEVDPEGALLWEYINPFKSPNPNRFNIRLVYRAHKVPVAWAASRLTPDLVVSATPSAESVVAGDLLTYTVELSNTGVAAASDVQLTEELPPDTTFQSIVAPAGWTCSTPAVGESGIVQCDNVNMYGTSNASFGIQVQVNPCAGDQTLWLTSSASSADDDLTPGDNSTETDAQVFAVDCSDDNPCTVDSCDTSLQACSNVEIVCEALSACHAPGVCDPNVGTCSNPPLQDGAACDDASAGICGGSCVAGACAGEVIDQPEAVGDTLSVDKVAGDTTVFWAADAGEFNVYRGVLEEAMGFAYNHQCLTQAGATTATSHTDLDDLGSTSGVYYLVTRIEQCLESVSGLDSFGQSRSDPESCPSGAI